MARLYRRTLASPRPSTRLERHAAGGVSEREPGCFILPRRQPR
jgi:hypothetical protein